VDLIAALREGVADIETGRLLTLEQVDAEFEVSIGALRKSQEGSRGIG